MLARYGRREILVGGFLLGGGLIASLAWRLWWVAPIPLVLLGFLLWFFRDPSRQVPEGENSLVAPADGRVIGIDEVFETDYLNEPATRVSIFLSALDVHVNRAPCAGVVEYLNYSAGKFHPAWGDAASKENESNSIGICSSGACGRVLVKQIAGILARRIVCDAEVSDRLTKGQKIGMIKLGSRAELYVARSTGFQARVAVRDKVRAGETLVGDAPKPHEKGEEK
jgi:phosphatidylserine decarboxylase